MLAVISVGRNDQKMGITPDRTASTVSAYIVVLEALEQVCHLCSVLLPCRVLFTCAMIDMISAVKAAQNLLDEDLLFRAISQECCVFIPHVYGLKSAKQRPVNQPCRVVGVILQVAKVAICRLPDNLQYVMPPILCVAIRIVFPGPPRVRGVLIISRV